MSGSGRGRPPRKAYRVGERTSAPTSFFASDSERFQSNSTIGIANASVFPEPVQACKTRTVKSLARLKQNEPQKEETSRRNVSNLHTRVLVGQQHWYRGRLHWCRVGKPQFLQHTQRRRRQAWRQRRKFHRRHSFQSFRKRKKKK